MRTGLFVHEKNASTGTSDSKNFTACALRRQQLDANLGSFLSDGTL